MNHIIRLTLLLGLLLAAGGVRGDDDPPKKQELAPWAKEVKAHAERFVEAFNKGDAKAVAAGYAQGAVVSLNGEKIAEGREEIEKAYADLFKDNPGAKIVVNINRMRIAGAGVAIETGTSQMLGKDGDSPVLDAYTAVHSKVDGRWQTITVDIDQEPAEPGIDWKKELGFLIGDWAAEGKGWKITSKIEWVAGGNFLKRSFEVSADGKVESSGVQVIGWDPLSGSVTSWEFGADGGHGRGWWAKDESNWVIQSESVTAAGEIMQATNMLTLLGEDEFRWQSTNRSVQGVALENTDSIRVRRVKPGTDRGAAATPAGPPRRAPGGIGN